MSRLRWQHLVLAGFALPLAAQQTAEEALARLRAGNERFASGSAVPPQPDAGLRRTLARGENPVAIVLCCADARVPPEHVFNAGLGELSVVRVAANVVDAEVLASVEYTAERLGVQLCVVLGHEGCDAIAAGAAAMQRAAAGTPPVAESPALQQLLQQLEPDVQAGIGQQLDGKALTDFAEAEHCQRMAVELLRRSPLLQHLAQQGRFKVLPARYRLETGVVDWLAARALPPADAAPATATAAPPAVAPHVALRLLESGHRRFLGDGKPLGNLGAARRQALAPGQQPLAIVATCSDSRTAPEHLFDAGLGELFVVRMAGTAVNGDVVASVEYAALHTGAPLLVVMGHTACSAIAAAVEHADDAKLTPNARALADRLAPAVEKARASGRTGPPLLDLAIRTQALRAVAQLRQQSAVLRELERQGRFELLACIYDLDTGDLEWLPASGGEGAPELAPTATPDVPPPAPAGESAPHAENGPQPAADEHAPAPGDGTETAAPPVPCEPGPAASARPVTAPQPASTFPLDRAVLMLALVLTSLMLGVALLRRRPDA